jgi:hypothetical protein
MSIRGTLCIQSKGLCSSSFTFIDFVDSFEDDLQNQSPQHLEAYLNKVYAALKDLGDLTDEISSSLQELSFLIWNICLPWTKKEPLLAEHGVRWRQLACDCLSLGAAGNNDVKLNLTLLQFYSWTAKQWIGTNISRV